MKSNFALSLALSLTLSLAFSPFCSPLFAQGLSVEALEQILKASESLTDLELKAKLQERYQKALKNLQNAQSFFNKKEEFQTQSREAPLSLQKIKTEMLAFVETPLSLNNTPLKELEKLQETEETTLARLTRKLTKLEEDLKNREKRKQEIPQQLLFFQGKPFIQAPSLSAPPPTDFPLFTSFLSLEEADKILEYTQKLMEYYEYLSLKEEFIFYENTAELLDFLRKQNLQELGVSTKKVEELKKKIVEKNKNALEFTTISLEQIQQEFKDLETKNLEEEVRKKLQDLYQKTIIQLQLSENFLEKISNFDKFRIEAPLVLERIRAELAIPQAFIKPEISPNTPVNQFEQNLTSAKIEQSEIKNKQIELENEAQFRTKRREELFKLNQEAKQRLENASKSSDILPESNEHSWIFSAKRKLLYAREKAILNEIRLYEVELLSYDARKEVLPARLAQNTRRISQNEKLIKFWEETIAERRRLEAQENMKKAQEALRQMAHSHPVVLQIAQENEELAKKRSGSTGLLQQIEAQKQFLENAKTNYSELVESSKWVQEQIEVAGLTEEIGRLLRYQKENFLDLRKYRKQHQTRQSEMAHVRLLLLEIPKKKKQTDDIDRIEDKIQTILKQLQPQPKPEEIEAIYQVLQNLLKDQASYFELLLSDYKTYLHLLVELDTQEEQLIEKAEEYNTFIQQYILWIRNSTFFNKKHLQESWEAFKYFFQLSLWKQIVQRLQQESLQYPLSFFLFCAGLLTFAVVRIFLKEKLKTINKNANQLSLAQESSSSLYRTLKAFLLNGLISLFFPLFLMILAWRLSLFENFEFAVAIGRALFLVSFYGFFFEFLRHAFLPKALAEQHFRWNPKALSQLNTLILWIIFSFLPCLFFTYLFDYQSEDRFRESLGRLSLLACLSLFILFAWKGKVPLRVILEGAFPKPAHWIDRFFKLWPLFFLIFPLSLSILALVGYSYSALQVQKYYHQTLALFVVLLFFHAILVRWLAWARLQIVLSQYPPPQPPPPKPPKNSESQSSEQQRMNDLDSPPTATFTLPPTAPTNPNATLPSPKEPTAPTSSNKRTKTSLILNPLPVSPLSASEFNTKPEEKVDLAKIHEQTQKLTKMLLTFALLVGFILIWSQVFPALYLFNEVKLATIPFVGPFLGSLSLSDFLLAILCIYFTTVLYRNTPGLLEMALLQNSSLDAGTRYTIIILTKYSIILIGLTFFLNLLGLNWSKIQWLLTAFGVGLGFGLQEIFANFVSGIIMLFEQPIRVGDTVTVGGTSGVVSNIQIRATTILDWDRKELIIPNKQFITENVVNWSLSNRMLRIVIPVRVAYGTPLQKAHDILLEVARQHPHVLENPKTRAWVNGFGENAIEFELRVYIADHDFFPQVRHELIFAIDHAYREAGIVIALPQRDIRLTPIDKTIPPFFQKDREED
jgi:potassium efflux system protein